MGRIHVSTDIDATPEDIWRYVEQIERHTEWMADARSIRFVTDQTRGVGTTFTCETRIGPLHLDDQMEITRWEPSQAMAVRHHGIVTGEGTFTIEPINALTTRFDWDESLSWPWYLLGSLGERLGGALVLRAVWRRNLGRLKQRVEAS